MIKRNRATISKFIIHKVGNKFNSATNVFSEDVITFDEESYELMKPYLLKPFANVSESFRFNHHANIELNEINSYISQIFSDETTFVEISKHIVTHLFEQSNSAQIKIGDVIIALFEDIEYKDVVTQAVGIFKIENKINFFQTFMEKDSLDVFVQKGISTKKLDKGCLIINSTDAEGRIVLSVDTNNYDAQYWLNNFLNVKYADDNNQHTQNYLEMCKDFSEEVIKEDFGIHEKSKFLAKTVDFFKENEAININDFKEQIFEENDAHKTLFDDYKKQFETVNDVLVRNQFAVSDIVLKKQKQKIKTEIKLDTNIQIKLDIDAPDAASEYLEKGFDEVKKMKFYKVYFNEED
ncbi:MAG: nucleoid-associated protein [Lutibacter sp.]|uniref:nucleoid-associated protein n=1 Tax=Lutibacter sp. TaxID=1925666 RepID=UPI0017AB35BF|nr:nucleoid-associated protein [Lutibacter sp.]MBT8318407.1 nucleoid-associated protein [Lutibacter sp.]NNJ59265.1 nucleoid-associated protein [Lutibacter sp.]